MQVDRDVERLAGLEDRPELRVVEVLAVRVRVDDDALEAELAHAALDLLGGRRGILRCRGRQTGVALGIARDRGRELVVGIVRDGVGRGRVEHLHARAGQRQDLHVDAGVVHVGEPPLAEVLQALDDRGRARTRAAEIEAPQARKSGIVERPAASSLR